jgi:hypothetical protein
LKFDLILRVTNFQDQLILWAYLRVNFHQASANFYNLNF